MSVTTPTRPSAATRRVGYLAAALINVVLIYLVHVDPGWEAVPFLTDDAGRVIGPVTASLVAGVAVNLLFTVTDPPWLRAVGGLVTTGIGLVALVRLWQVFPFDVGDGWALWIHIALVIALAGSVIGLIAQGVALVRAVTGACRSDSSDQGGSDADPGGHRV